MPSKDHDDRDGVAVEYAAESTTSTTQEKRRSSRTQEERDRDREHRHRHRSSRSSKLRTDSDLTQSSTSHRRRRTKDRDGDEEKDRDRDRDRERRHRRREEGHRSRRDRSRDRDRGSEDPRGHEDESVLAPTSEVTEATNDVVPELWSRVSRPYPTFSAAHSKENVRESVVSRDDVSQIPLVPPPRETHPLTPEATDLGSANDRKRDEPENGSLDRKQSTRSSSSRKGDPPPSPPATNLSEPKDRRSGTPTSSRSSREKESEERPRSRTSWLSRSTSKHDDRSKLSTKSKASSQTTIQSPNSPLKNPTIESLQDSAFRPASRSPSSSKRSASGRTVRLDTGDSDLSPESVQDSSPKTPVATPQFPPPPPIFLPNESQKQFRTVNLSSGTGTPATPDFGAIPPPPPPPPPLNIQEVPKVNYLTQNGGLPKPISKYFLDALPRLPPGTRPFNPPLKGAETLFAPFFNQLDQYLSVLDRQGSIAVATGHKTIARRILDRLDNVFTRDLPADGCSCIICERNGGLQHGVGWGEVLERYKSENPQWPPFDLTLLSAKAAEESADIPPRPDSPVKMDPDIAEEFRGHYLKQNKKVKAAVDKWLTSCSESPAPPPTDVDDETLTFAILTNLDQDEQPYFNALLAGSRELQPALRSPTPFRKPRQDFIVRTGLAIQRYYALPQAPRDAEVAMYLIKNRHMHDILRAVADINPSEWELLISGRFDGFLWSGADDGGDDVATPIAETPSRGGTPANASGFFFQQPSRTGGNYPFAPSRGTTPFSRGPTPASFVSGTSSVVVGPSGSGGGPRTAVSLDEELEVQTCAEVERFIYLGMEALEDAFETLHQRAEMARQKLRQRNAGLQMGLQRNRVGPGVAVAMESPGLSNDSLGGGPNGDEDFSAASESDWGADDYMELKPDDSASNISSSRHRRPKRRNERRTPAPIEEEEEY